LILLDVNVLVHAHRRDAAQHKALYRWLNGVVASEPLFGVPAIVFSGFIRIVTHPKILRDPSTVDEALTFAENLRRAPNHVDVRPGPGHWRRFTELCRATNARGNHVPDAFLAALALETGAEWITADRGFARYPGLRWRHPLD
jgi:toxin-antitoxin system PIN domain toxin